jgi:hypothetical protein
VLTHLTSLPPSTSQHPPTPTRPTTPRRPGHYHANNKTPPPATPIKSTHMHLVTSWHALCHSANAAPSQPAGLPPAGVRVQGSASRVVRAVLGVPLCRPGTG